MSWYHGICDCCGGAGVNECGIPASGWTVSFCTALGNASCPDSYSVGLSIPSRDQVIKCGSDISATCEDYGTIPAFSGSVTVTKNAANSCTYTGTQSVAGSWTGTGCPPLDIETFYDDRELEITLGSYVITGIGFASILDGCGGGSGGADCCGLVVGIKESFHNNSTSSRAYHYAWALRYHLKQITSCDVDCPCYTWVAGTADEMKSMLTNCTDELDPCCAPVYKISCGSGTTGFCTDYVASVSSIS